MSKNIVIFSDGTGQAGGLRPDERRSNVYKLHRSARCGTDSEVDPSKQLAFYDAGLGSPADGGGFWMQSGRMIYNLVSQATGLGITRNIIDCYSAILRMYEPGDRIFLFGFSRGAYTVRCVGGVLKLCGVPTTDKSGNSLKRDPRSIRRVAAEAVKRVYQHGSGRGKQRFHDQRVLLGKQYRREYASGKGTASNVVPYFVGVWDTVAATGMRPQVGLFVAIGLVIALTAIASGIWWLLTFLIPWLPYWWWITGTLGVVVLIAAIVMVGMRYRRARGIGVPWWKSVHLTGWRMRFYDKTLDPAVEYAKHALSIDENRKDFQRVEWSDIGVGESPRSNEDGWFEQVWFSGVHSDIGGSYPENEARLSDIALEWMVEKATGVPHPLILDRRFLNLFPDSVGPQHDERKSSAFPWKEQLRSIPNDAPLHPSVVERLQAEAVLHYDEMRPYRPSSLEGHQALKGKN